MNMDERSLDIRWVFEAVGRVRGVENSSLLVRNFHRIHRNGMKMGNFCI